MIYIQQRKHPMQIDTNKLKDEVLEANHTKQETKRTYQVIYKLLRTTFLTMLVQIKQTIIQEFFN